MIKALTNLNTKMLTVKNVFVTESQWTGYTRLSDKTLIKSGQILTKQK